jgi:predicted  nucleic acid-binding Zn-ribbon protein
MDGLSGAASVIAVIDLSAKITALCSQYIAAVKDAKNDVERIRKKVGDIKQVVESIEKLLDGPHKAKISTTHGLFKSLKQCFGQLQQLEEQLKPGKTRKAMNRFGVQALKWPFTSKQVEDTLSSLEVYERSFTLALQVDQTQVFCLLFSNTSKNG